MILITYLKLILKKQEYIKETHTQEISKTYEEIVNLTKIKEENKSRWRRYY